MAFLITAVVPVCIAGLVGIFYSLNALKNETLHHLGQEVGNRSDGMARFFDQLSSELLYLSGSSPLRELADTLTISRRGLSREARRRMERDLAAFAKIYPFIYQIRVLAEDGKEVVRVDRRDDRLYVVPEHELQDKSDRYYFHEGFARVPGEIYISPLDLNVEQGMVEIPAKPVVRFGTPVADSGGRKRGLLIVNLHAEFVLGQMQEMAGARGGTAYLFDRSGFYLSRTGGSVGSNQSFEMKSTEALTQVYPRDLLSRILSGARGTEVSGEWIVAYAPVVNRATLFKDNLPSVGWAIALAFPQKRLFAAVFNLYILYGVLTLCLIATAVAGYLLSRHLLRPLMLLQAETGELAKGNFSHRVEVRGSDEIAELGQRFNLMAARLEQLYAALERRKEVLEAEVAARTFALEKERRNLEAVVENTADGILAVDSQGKIKLANREAERVFGSEPGSLAARAMVDLWSGWPEHFGPGGSASAVNQRIEIALGDKTVEFTVSPVGAPGTERGYIVVVRDVSQERRLSEERREFDRQMFQMEKMTTMGELAMGLAHEIGNPLAGMKAVVQALLEEKDLNEYTRKYLGRIQNEVDRLSAFLRTFHGFSAPQETHPVPCRLEDVLDDVLLWTRKEAKSKGINISFLQCAERSPDLWADPSQLKQLLLNLVINSIHAMEGGGQITIGMCGLTDDLGQVPGDVPRICFCARDTGPGIPPEVLPRIFDPFFTTRDGGSGLGLAVVKKIAVQHGADIRVESEVGRGTRFELVWPVVLKEGETLTDFREHATPQCAALRIVHG